MKSTVLVLGSTSLISQLVTRQLVNDGFTVKALVRNKVKAHALLGDTVELTTGDATRKDDIERALSGCNRVHISLTAPAELTAVQHITALAQDIPFAKISYVSGSTVSEANAFYPMVKAKLAAERLIVDSGVPYQIFRPSIFEETLANFVNNGRASVLGKQAKSYHLVSGTEFAQLVSNEFIKDGNFREQIFGEAAVTLNDALKAYCARHHPEIKKVSNLPHGMAKMIALLTRTPALKEASNFMAYLEKVGEGYSEDGAKMQFA